MMPHVMYIILRFSFCSVGLGPFLVNKNNEKTARVRNNIAALVRCIFPCREMCSPKRQGNHDTDNAERPAMFPAQWSHFE